MGAHGLPGAPPGPLLDRFWDDFGALRDRFWINFGTILERFLVDAEPILGRFWIDFWLRLGVIQNDFLSAFQSPHGVVHCGSGGWSILD